jgi:hypothetical protein
LLGDLDIGIRLMVSAVSGAFERSVPSRHSVRLEHTLVMVSKNCGSDIVLFIWYLLNRGRIEVYRCTMELAALTRE